ncbi:MAG: hypothetical protein J1G06_02465 [Oscillospiraceae bacterium]|nr:hypothetical protein [Oscillospiraceae bacterium]
MICTKKKNMAALIKRVAAAALVIVLMVAFGGCSSTKGSKGSTGSSQQQAADSLAQAINSGNMEKVMKAMLPDKAIKKLEDESGMSLSSIASMYGAGSFEGVSNCKITVKEKQDIDKDDVESFKENAEENLGVSVSDVEMREIEMTATAYGSTDTATGDAIFYKADGKWYIIPSDM